MTTIYGEGDKAFQRLQYEILSQVVDHSIFAWVHTDAGQEDTASGLLASSPSAFSCSGDIVTIPHRIFADQWRHSGQLPAQHVQRTAGGLVLELPLLDRLPKENHYLMAIACGKRGQNACGQSQHCLGIVVSLGMDDRYRRVPGIAWIDAGRLRRQEHAFKLGRLETMESAVQPAHARESVTETEVEGKDCQIRIAASMLQRVQEDHRLKFVHITSNVNYSQYREEEDPETREKHIIFTAPYYSPEYHQKYLFRLVWNWSGETLEIHIDLDIKNPIQFNGIWSSK